MVQLAAALLRAGTGLGRPQLSDGAAALGAELAVRAGMAGHGVLLFAPGLAEIGALQAAVEAAACGAGVGDRVHGCVLHSLVPAEEQEAALAPPPEGCFKVPPIFPLRFPPPTPPAGRETGTPAPGRVAGSAGRFHLGKVVHPRPRIKHKSFRGCVIETIVPPYGCGRGYKSAASGELPDLPGVKCRRRNYSKCPYHRLRPSRFRGLE